MADRILELRRSPAGPPSRPVLADDAIDQELMERIGRDEQTVFAELVDRYWKRLVKYAMRLVGDLEGAEDVVQDAFVRVWLNRGRWRPTGTVRSYMYRIARNLALQELEKRGVRKRWREAPFGDRPRTPTPAEEFDRETLAAELERAVSALPPRRREILVLARFHGLSYRQISEVMGISVQTVANQMSAALRELRGVLADHER